MEKITRGGEKDRWNPKRLHIRLLPSKTNSMHHPSLPPAYLALMVTRKPSLARTELLLGDPSIILQGVKLVEIDALNDLIVLLKVLVGHGETTEEGKDDEACHPQRGSDIMFLRQAYGALVDGCMYACVLLEGCKDENAAEVAKWNRRGVEGRRGMRRRWRNEAEGRRREKEHKQVEEGRGRWRHIECDGRGGEGGRE